MKISGVTHKPSVIESRLYEHMQEFDACVADYSAITESAHASGYPFSTEFHDLLVELNGTVNWLLVLEVLAAEERGLTPL